MSVMSKLRKDIAALDAEITATEIKRSRSEAAIIEALSMGNDPDENDVKYFRQYTKDIDEKRAQIILMQQQLDTMY